MSANDPYPCITQLTRHQHFLNKEHYDPLIFLLPIMQLTVKKKATVMTLLVIAMLCIIVFMSDIQNDKERKIKTRETLSSQATPEESLSRHCACKHCMTQPKISEWFDKHFNPSIHPLLSEKNFNLSAETLAWWKNLQPYYRPPPFSVLMRKVFELFPGEEQLRNRSGRRCLSCAVVGNSDNLLGSSYGPQIDDHDFVMRMNEAKTKGYEKDVGWRTTHHFMYPESAMDLDNDTSLVLIPFKMRDFEWLISVVTDGSVRYTYREVPARIKFNRQKVLFYNPAFLKYVNKQWTKTPRCPSTGMLVLLFAVHVCDEVSVYGYGANSQGQWKHYWENIPGSMHLAKHSGNIERNILQMLHDAGKVKFSTGKKDFAL